MEYSISIIAPKNGSSITHKFETKEQKEDYIIAETKATSPQLIALYKAVSKEEREKAYNNLYIARMNFYSKIFKPATPKEYA